MQIRGAPSIITTTRARHGQDTSEASRPSQVYKRIFNAAILTNGNGMAPGAQDVQGRGLSGMGWDFLREYPRRKNRSIRSSISVAPTTIVMLPPAVSPEQRLLSLIETVKHVYHLLADIAPCALLCCESQ
jgi:hypothetical protein